MVAQAKTEQWTGKFDAKSLINKTYKFKDIHKACRQAADGTVISNLITF